MRVIGRSFAAALLVSVFGTWVWSGFQDLALVSPAMALLSCDPDLEPQPDPNHCIAGWRCSNGRWVPWYAAAGAACEDGNPCTSDTCDAAHNCISGTPIVCAPRGPCEAARCVSGACAYTPLSARPCPAGASTNACEVVCDGSSPYCQPT